MELEENNLSELTNSLQNKHSEDIYKQIKETKAGKLLKKDLNLKAKSWRERKKCNKKNSSQLPVQEPYVSLNKCDVIRTLKFLKKKKDEVSSSTSRKLHACSKRKHAYKSDNIDSILWDSPTYIIKSIRLCILKQDWKKLPGLLEILSGYSTLYSSYIKEISYLIFLVQSDNAKHQNILDDFQDFCFVNISDNKPITEFDVWYKEG